MADGSNLVIGQGNSCESKTTLVRFGAAVDYGLEVINDHGPGLQGASRDGTGVSAEGQIIGMHGFAHLSTGLLGEAPAFGAIGRGGRIGVMGVADAKAATGVQGQADEGFGVIGTSNSGVAVGGVSMTSTGVGGLSDTGGGVVGVSARGSGVSGSSTKGAGVVGQSQQYIGVAGQSPFGTGVSGKSTKLVGVRGDSTDGVGVLGNSEHASGVIGTSNEWAGVAGFSQGNGVGVQGDSPFVGIWGESQAGLAGYFKGRVVILGSLVVYGQKSAAVPLADGSHRLLYAVESPESWFEDFGRARLVQGKATVRLDSMFTKVTHTTDYHVFLTPEGDSNGLYVVRRMRGAFEVREQQRGRSNVRFSYRVVARRKDVKAPRFATAPALPERRKRMPAPPKPPAHPEVPHDMVLPKLPAIPRSRRSRPPRT